MKYLVTFAYANNVEVLRHDSRKDESEQTIEYIDNIKFHSVIIEKKENQTLSDTIEEVKISFHDEKIENENRLWSPEYNWYSIEWIKCIGITPIVNDEIEEAIQKHCNDSFRN